MVSQITRRFGTLVTIAMISIPSRTCWGGDKVSPTGLYGGTAPCPDGPRPLLDCRGALRQVSRDFKLDLGVEGVAAIGLGRTSNKLAEADALTSDMIQTCYLACTQYNACILSRAEYAERTLRLQNLQLEVRKTVGPAVGASSAPTEQNIQINAPGGGGQSQGGMASANNSSAPGGEPAPGGDAGAVATGGTAGKLDTLLSFLRPASRILGTPREKDDAAAPEKDAAAPEVAVTSEKVDVHDALTSSLTTLQKDTAKKRPAIAAGHTVVRNFKQTGKAWTSPIGAALQDRVSTIVASGVAFKPASKSKSMTTETTRGITRPQQDLAISGDYRVEGDRVRVRLASLDKGGSQIAETEALIPLSAFPGSPAATAGNAAETSEFLAALEKAAPRDENSGKIQLTTNRPGAGASYRLDQDIKFYVKSITAEGYLYLFHVDAEKTVTRIFPNKVQKQAQIRAGTTLELMPPGAAPFAASPPFGLETTVAIVSQTPMDDKSLEIDPETGFGTPKAKTSSSSRGITLRTAGRNVEASVLPVPTDSIVWTYVTVLIRP